MELFTIVLCGLLGLATPVGLVIDRTAEHTIRSQFTKVGKLVVRVDNTPSYQILQGKVAKIRIAGRSLQLKRQDVRIALFELETDAIELELSSLRQKRPKLKRPLQAGVRLILNQEDVNKFLQSPQIMTRLGSLSVNSIKSPTSKTNPRYKFINPQVKFLGNRCLLFQVELQEGKQKPILIKVESGLNVVTGRYIQLVNPMVAVNGEEVPRQFVNEIVDTLNKRLDLGNLEGGGLQVRILKLEMKPTQLEIAAFLRIKPSSRFLETRGL